MAKFSKCHYEAIATAMQKARPTPTGLADHVADVVWSACCIQLANTLASDNGAFKRDRFLTACNPGNNVKARG